MTRGYKEDLLGCSHASISNDAFPYAESDRWPWNSPSKSMGLGQLGALVGAALLCNAT